jgi:PEP-CTERM motif
LFQASIFDGGPVAPCPASFVACINAGQATGWYSPHGTLYNSPDDTLFESVIAVAGQHPVITLSFSRVLSLTGAPSSFDFSNTSTVTLTLPDGVTNTSDSGVFGTESAAATPEPASFALPGLGIASLAAASFRLRKRA